MAVSFVVLGGAGEYPESLGAMTKMRMEPEQEWKPGRAVNVLPWKSVR